MPETKSESVSFVQPLSLKKQVLEWGSYSEKKKKKLSTILSLYWEILNPKISWFFERPSVTVSTDVTELLTLTSELGSDLTGTPGCVDFWYDQKYTC